MHQQRNILVIGIGKEGKMLWLGVEDFFAVWRRSNNLKIGQDLLFVGFSLGRIVGIRKGQSVPWLWIFDKMNQFICLQITSNRI